MQATVASWQQIILNSRNVPSERWGHRLVQVGEGELVLFGGFGGDGSDGKYLNDVWALSLQDYQWREIATTGDIPETRSNYTMHYNAVDNEIIIFGGGSDHKTRYNSVCLLNWATKEWTRVLPVQSDEAPWERTYHSSEFVYPYMVVFGGEGVSNLDLDDMWVFNVLTHQWTRLIFAENSLTPQRRRFQSSVLVNGVYYIIGGCTGNYQLLADMYRVDLNNLFEKGETIGFKWECVTNGHRLLERWGHSSELFGGKVYCFAGRTSATADNNDVFTFDPATNEFEPIDVDQQNAPKARRRHATALIGNSMLVFGGYNGKYLKDMHYLSLHNTKSKSSTDIKMVVLPSKKDLLAIVAEVETQIQGNIKVGVYSESKMISCLKTNESLANNPFFLHLLGYSNRKVTLQLPPFCDLLVLRLLHLSIITRNFYLSTDLTTDFYLSLFHSIEYFCFSELTPLLEQYLADHANPQNCKQLLDMGLQLGLNTLTSSAAEIYLVKASNSKILDLREIEKEERKNTHSPEEIVEGDKSEELNLTQLRKVALERVFGNMRFDIEQSRMRSQNQNNVFRKAAKSFNRLFSSSSTQRESKISTGKPHQPQKGCFQRFLGFISGLCNHSRVQQEEHIQ